MGPRQLLPLAGLVLLLGTAVLAASPAHAAPGGGTEARTPGALVLEQVLAVLGMAGPDIATVLIAPTGAPEIRSRTEPFLEQLLAEINLRRDRAGTRRLAYVGGHANQAVGAYLADLTPAMEAAGSCFHGARMGWDYVASVELAGDTGGEVIACPADGGYWTAERIAEAWWTSPIHHRILYGDGGARALACGTYGQQRGGSAYRTIACVTYRS